MDWFKDNIFIIVGIISPVIAWFGSKRYFAEKELKSKDIENDSGISEVLNKNLDLYQRMLDDIELRYEKMISKRDNDIEILEAEVKNLDNEISLLKEEIDDLELKITKLKAKIEHLENLI